MTRSYRVNDVDPTYTLDLIVDGVVTATLPFTELIDAHEFGFDFVTRGVGEQRSREHHPAGRRLAE